MAKIIRWIQIKKNICQKHNADVARYLYIPTTKRHKLKIWKYSQWLTVSSKPITIDEMNNISKKQSVHIQQPMDLVEKSN